jgi:hypothetical protein
MTTGGATLSYTGEAFVTILRIASSVSSSASERTRTATRTPSRPACVGLSWRNPLRSIALSTETSSASSARTDRHRLDRGGNRQLNCALHRLAISRGRLDPETAAYLARKQSEGKSRREALRCLKRHLARRVWRLLQPPAPPRNALADAEPSRPTKLVTIHCNTPTGSFALT